MPALLRAALLALSGAILIFFAIIGLAPEEGRESTVESPTPYEPTAETIPSESEQVSETEEPIKEDSPPVVHNSEVSEADVQKKIEETVTSINQTIVEFAEQDIVSTVPPDYKFLNENVRSALVNIICTTDGAGTLNPISASGVVIDSRGVVLTNAHVAQYLLLKDYPREGFVTCIIRAGSPARPLYSVELMFLPPSWIEANAGKITQENPTGNGDHDYALLRITGVVQESISMPTAFAYLPLSYDPPIGQAEVLIAGYPAGFLGGITILRDLYAASSIARIGEMYTFGGNTPDIFSIGGSVVAQRGSSGGAVANLSGSLIGLITTSSDAPDTASRDLRALATSYIAWDFSRERGKSLVDYLAGDPSKEAESFRVTTAPTLTQSLINALEGT